MTKETRLSDKEKKKRIREIKKILVELRGNPQRIREIKKILVEC